MKYKVTTSSIVITEYIVEAETAESAEEKFWNGYAENGKAVDFQD